MKLKELKISDLIESYEDTGLMPADDCLDQERIKERVMRRVRQDQKKKHKVLLAAAVLAACLGLAGWTCGAEVYQFFCGGQLIYGDREASLEWDQEGEMEILSVENGRIWFVADGQRLDITDQIDEQTPYIYTSQDPEGNRRYLIVGGTTERYGWVERWERGDGTEAAELCDRVTGSGGAEPEWLRNARTQLGIEREHGIR